MKRVILIDADILVYHTACAAEQEIDWGEGLHTLHSDFHAAQFSLVRMIEKIHEQIGGGKIILALTTLENNWRRNVYEPYKANRAGNRKPLCWKALREWLAEHYEVFLRDTLEGDDVLGILATRQHNAAKEDRVIASMDKDMQGIPCQFFNLNKREEGIKVITEAEANRFHMMQTLTGDTCDNYPGCPGIGPVKAAAILDAVEPTYEAMWPAVVAAYEKKGLTEADALAQARVARILRAEDYDFEKREVILWEPPSSK